MNRGEGYEDRDIECWGRADGFVWGARGEEDCYVEEVGCD